MDNTVATAFYPDDDSPLIQYEIAFQKKPKLLAAGVGAKTHRCGPRAKTQRCGRYGLNAKNI